MKRPRSILFPVALGVAWLMAGCDSDWPYRPTQFVMPVDSTASFVEGSTISSFVGTTNAKIAFCLNDANGTLRNVFVVDFSSGKSRPVLLAKPSDRQTGWSGDSPLLSPDGNWVTYTLVNFSTLAGEVYVQKADGSAAAKLLAHGTDPHWWQDSAASKLYVIYSDTGGAMGILNRPLDSLKGEKFTWKQEVSASDPTTTLNARDTLAPYPMVGGLSKDGRYLCTGYSQAAFYDIQTQTLSYVNGLRLSWAQICNPSIYPGDSAPMRMMFLNINGVQQMNGLTGALAGNLAEHKYIFIVDVGNNVLDAFDDSTMFNNQSGAVEWQNPEWSNRPEYFVATKMIAAGDATHWNGFIVRISDKHYLQFNNGTPKGVNLQSNSTPSLWIGG